MEDRAYEDGRKDGVEEGRKQGLEEGQKQGIELGSNQKLQGWLAAPYLQALSPG